MPEQATQPDEHIVDIEPGEVELEQLENPAHTCVVRDIGGRNTVCTLNSHAVGKHGIQRGTEVVVSASYLSGRGHVERVTRAAPIDGGAMCLVRFEDGDGSWVPLVAMRRVDGGEPYR